MSNIQYLDINGLAYYDARIKQFIEDNIPEAAEAFVNAVQESGESEILKIAVCTQATYDALGDNWEEGTLYIISDDNTLTQLTGLINGVSTDLGNEITRAVAAEQLLDNKKVDKADIGYLEIDVTQIQTDPPTITLTQSQLAEINKHYCIVKIISNNDEIILYKSVLDDDELSSSTIIKFHSTVGFSQEQDVIELEYIEMQVNTNTGIATFSQLNEEHYTTAGTNNKLNADVEIKPTGTDNVFTYNGDTVNATFRFKNLSSGTTSSKTETLGLANQTTAGLMSYTDYLALQNVIERVGHLEGQTSRLLYVVNDTLKTIDTYSPAFYINGEIYEITNSTTITKVSTGDTYTISNNTAVIDGITYVFDGLTVGSNITREANATNINAFAILSGYTNPFKGVAVVTQDYYHIWRYYTNEDDGVVIGWKDDGQDTVSQFTNTVPGIIQGSNADGKISAQVDGTGSVNGWNKVTTLDGYFTDGVTTETWVFIVKDTVTGEERPLNKTVYMVPEPESGE